MKMKLEAGAEFDFVSPKELRDTMAETVKAWAVEARKGPAPVTFSGQATIAGAVVQLGGTDGNGQGVFGPDSGFLWSVQRLCVSGIQPSAESLSLYVNNESPLTKVMDGVTGYQSFSTHQMLLTSTARLLLVGRNLVSTGVVTVSGSAMQVPVGLGWKFA